MSSRRVKLTVIDSNQPSWTPRLDVPRTRAECPPYRPCDRIRCRQNLFRDDQPAGRPSLSRVERNEKGRVVRQLGNLGEQAGGNPPCVDARAPWLQNLPSCALDVAESGAAIGLAELGALMNRHRTLVARLLKAAAKSLAAKGVTADDLMLLIEHKPANGNLAELIGKASSGVVRRKGPGR